MQWLLLSAALCAAAPALAADAEAQRSHGTAPAKLPMDTRLIHDLLDTYTKSVSTGNREAFEQLLLDEKIPFYGLAGKLPAGFEPSLKSVQDYAGFRKDVFESGTHFAQRFSDVRIEQDGDLAQVSLHFETRVVGTGDGGKGWKVLQLLKVGGHWKIASEFYTAYPLQAQDR